MKLEERAIELSYAPAANVRWEEVPTAHLTPNLVSPCENNKLYVNQHIANDSEVGDNCILVGCKIGDDFKAGKHCRLELCLVGDRCTLAENAQLIGTTLGNDGTIEIQCFMITLWEGRSTHESSILERTRVGLRTKIGDWLTTGDFVEIGSESQLGQCGRIGSYSRLGNGVRVSHADMGYFITIGEGFHSFGSLRTEYKARIGPNAIFEGDVHLGKESELGPNASFYGEVRIDEKSEVGAGAKFRHRVNFGTGTRIGEPEYFLKGVSYDDSDVHVIVDPEKDWWGVPIDTWLRKHGHAENLRRHGKEKGT